MVNDYDGSGMHLPAAVLSSIADNASERRGEGATIDEGVESQKDEFKNGIARKPLHSH